MRQGENISRNKKLELVEAEHRVIIPLYIPHENDYYKDAFQIFEMCLHSIIKTSSSQIKISVISNGSSNPVNNKLINLYLDGHINELIIEREPIGKINSILKALRTADERLITITDADVMFLNNWEEAVVNVFKAFPKAGMVSPVPVFRTQLRHTSNIWFDYLFSKRLKFTPVKNPEDLTRFANSIGWSYLNDKVKDVIATITSKNNTIAVVGNSHFVGTYKNEVFKTLPKDNSTFKLGGNSEQLYTDMPVIKSGGYRLATNDNFAYHLGNTLEDWMLEKYNALKVTPKNELDLAQLQFLKSNWFIYVLKFKLFKKLLFYKFFKKWIYKQKGLNKKQLKTFLEAEF
jgi:hypothetical protein